MAVFCMKDSRRRVLRAATLIVAVAAAAFTLAAQGQVEEAVASQDAPATPPYAMLQYSTLTGSGNTITATRVPVVTST